MADLNKIVEDLSSLTVLLTPPETRFRIIVDAARFD